MRGYLLENKNSAIDKNHVTLSQILIIQYILFTSLSLQNNT